MPRAKTQVKSSKSKVVKSVPKAEAKASGLSAPVFDVKGAKAGTIALPKEIFGANVNDKLMSQAVRVYLANQRMGTASVKTRGEVRGSTKKIYKQKGTGNARHGGKRAPIFVHGGVAMGPKPHDFHLSLPRKMRKVALLSALSSKLKDGEVKVLSGFEKIEPKTKIMDKALRNIYKDGRKSVILVTYKSDKELDNLKRASKNLKDLRIMNADLLNTYEVLKTSELLFLKNSIDALKSTFLGETK